MSIILYPAIDDLLLFIQMFYVYFIEWSTWCRTFGLLEQSDDSTTGRALSSPTAATATIQKWTGKSFHI